MQSINLFRSNILLIGTVFVLLGSTVPTAHAQITETTSQCIPGPYNQDEITNLQNELSMAVAELNRAYERIQQLTWENNLLVNDAGRVPTLQQALQEAQAAVRDAEVAIRVWKEQREAAEEALRVATTAMLRIRFQLEKVRAELPVNEELEEQLTAQLLEAEQRYEIVANDLILNQSERLGWEELERWQDRVAEITQQLNRLQQQLNRLQRNEEEINQLYYNIRGILEPNLREINTKLNDAVRRGGTCQFNQPVTPFSDTGDNGGNIFDF